VFKTPIGWVRGIGMIEGVSYLVLLGIAMPLKYIFKIPEGEAVVFWVGLGHGVLFTAYAFVAFRANAKGQLSQKLLGYAALASVLPFGPFVLDRKLKVVEDSQGSTAKG
jgi:integral membrane protein